MRGIVNCCHAYLDSQPTRWICSTSVASSSTHEEVVGSDDKIYNAAADPLALKSMSASAPSRPIRAAVQQAPPAPEAEKESAKVRLQRLIREFAHNVVGPGLPVEAESVALRGFAGAKDSGHMEAYLRMDRRLSRIEIWPRQPDEGSPAEVAAVPLSNVSSIQKTSAIIEDVGPGSDPSPDRPAIPVLTIFRHEGPELRLSFDSTVSRDRTYTCLRIFQMSAGGQPSGQSAGEDSR
mmetsp:Transcript_72443/g.172671  ORF Transcript_72443/g.172671 Transcript_72443/m.172671 type:complete len:236 (+) Transcript_72443:89-796(+)